MQVTKVFILVVSLWGYNGDTWVYTGNQMVLKEPMPKEQCEVIAANWQKFEMNKYFRFSIECIEDFKKDNEIVLEAIKKDGYALEYADESFKKNKERFQN